MFSSGISVISKLFRKDPNCIGAGLQSVRNGTAWCKNLTIRDMKRRKVCKDVAVERLRLLGLKRNTILPIELREDACKQFDEKIPRVSALRQLTFRCVVTSRPRGNLPRWRISRFIFRNLCDYNKMAGVQRAMW